MLSIEDLPNELIYYLFSKLDFKSQIKLSLTCRRLFDCRKTYQNFEINFENISKIDFDFICKLIKNIPINSLILSDNCRTPGQIKLFLKQNFLERFHQLKTIKLIEINENDLDEILTILINNSNLESIKLIYREYFQLINSLTKSLLYQIFSLKNLREIELDIRMYQTDSIDWPQLDHIRSLSLFNLNLNQLIDIIQKCQQIQRIQLKNCLTTNFNRISSKLKHFENVQSFEIIQSDLIMENLEYLVSLMIHLQSLKIEGSTNLISIDFFQTNFIRLKNFQFFLRYSRKTPSIINSFKEQFENCYQNENYFYTIPSIQHHFNYSDLSSSNQLFDSVFHLDLNPKNLQSQLNSYELFSNIKILKLIIDDQCPSNCFELISKENLIELEMLISSRGSYLNLILRNFLDFLKEFVKLNSLQIFNRWHSIFSYLNINLFCSSIPKTIQHLNIDISNINQIFLLIEKLDFIQSFKFQYSFEKSVQIKDVLQYLIDQQLNSTYIFDIHYLSIWIDQQTKQSNSNKRMKIK